MVIITILLFVFKDDIINYTVKELNKNLKTEVKVKEIELTFWATFPNISVDFNGVFIQDALPNSTQADTLFCSDRIRLKFSPWDIWNDRYHVKGLEIENASVHLKVTDEGKVNYDILKESDSKESSDFEVKLNGIELHNVNFAYTNNAAEQKYTAKIHNANLEGAFDAEEFTIETQAEMTINRIQNGQIPFVVHQPAITSCSVLVDNKKGTVSIPDGKVMLANLPFRFSLLVTDTNVHTEVEAKQLNLQDVANNLTAKEVDEIDRFRGSGTVDFGLIFDNELKAESVPAIDCKFNIHNGRLTEPENNVTISALQLDGEYSTLKGKGKEWLALKKVAFRSSSGAFNGNCRIANFTMPTYSGKANGAVDLGIVHALFRFPKIKSVGGNVDLKTVFELKTVEVEGLQEIEIVEGSGTAKFHNASFQLENDSRAFRKINGDLKLNRTEATLDNCEVTLGSSDLRINGNFDNIDGFLQNRTNLSVDVITKSQHIDLADFTNSVVIQKSPEESYQPKEFMLPDKIDGKVALNVNRLKLDDHVFKDLHGDMTVGVRELNIRNLFGRSADASVSGTVHVQESSPEYFMMNSFLYSPDIQFKPLFKEWNNFEQDVITAANISGRAEVAMRMTAPFTFNYGIVKEHIDAELKVKVTNGALKNVSTLKALTADLKTPKTRMILKKRDVEALEGKLDNIKFETLENTIYIKNSKLFIPKMDIHSSALDITMEGTHSFSNYIDYSFAFRLRDLKVKKDESEFGIVEDDETGIRVYVRMYGDLDNPTIEWDKQSKQEQARENRQAVKNETMSILKSEFGLFKKDTAVKDYKPKVKQREVLEMKFGEDNTNDDLPEENKRSGKPPKKPIIGGAIQKLKDQNPKKPKEDFTVD